MVADTMTDMPKIKVLIDAIKIAYQVGSFGVNGNQQSLIKKSAGAVKKVKLSDKWYLAALICQLEYSQPITPSKTKSVKHSKRQ